jgi:hypothetical protein
MSFIARIKDNPDAAPGEGKTPYAAAHHLSTVNPKAMFFTDTGRPAGAEIFLAKTGARWGTATVLPETIKLADGGMITHANREPPPEAEVVTFIALHEDPYDTCFVCASKGWLDCRGVSVAQCASEMALQWHRTRAGYYASYNTARVYLDGAEDVIIAYVDMFDQGGIPAYRITYNNEVNP